MPHDNPTTEELRALLTTTKTIAVVGASSRPERPSHGIMHRLLDLGYRVLPVNPNEREVLGQTSYRSLIDIREPIDIVDVFRRSEFTPPIADEAVAIGAKALWLQSGVTSEEAARRAKAGGLMVIMDACIAVVHARLRIGARR